MKIAAVVSVLNQFEIAHQTVDFLLEGDGFDIYVVDNGSDKIFQHPNPRVKVIRFDEPIGSYPVFFEVLEETDADILAYFHSDFFVYDPEWSTKTLLQFESDGRLGMIGFIGSNEIDQLGGRGLGTASNFQGKATINQKTLERHGGADIWVGSPAEAHGKRLTGFMNAAVVDGCSMILRRVALEQISQRSNFPPHHFYDRLISTQLLEAGWKIGVLGIACDHISGQTVNQEQKYWNMAKQWCESHNTPPAGIGVNWDSEVYKEAERQWLSEYRDKKHLIPIKA